MQRDLHCTLYKNIIINKFYSTLNKKTTAIFTTHKSCTQFKQLLLIPKHYSKYNILFFFLFKVTTEHNHLPDEARINVQEANQDIRQRARESQDAPAVIRAEVMANMPDDRSRDVSRKLISVNLK